MTDTGQFVRLPDHLAKNIHAKGETGMGYQIVSVVLNNGQKFNQVVVVIPYIVGIRGLSKIPFEAGDVDDQKSLNQLASTKQGAVRH